jgi:hypothetical protein
LAHTRTSYQEMLDIMANRHKAVLLDSSATAANSATSTRKMANAPARDMELDLLSYSKSSIPLRTRNHHLRNILCSACTTCSSNDRTGTCYCLPPDVERTTTSEQPTFVRCHGSRPILYQEQENVTVYSHIQTCDHWAVKSLDCPMQGADIARALICGNAIAVCDGS